MLQIKSSHSVSWEEDSLLICVAGATDKALSDIQWMSLKGIIQKNVNVKLISTKIGEAILHSCKEN